MYESIEEIRRQWIESRPVYDFFRDVIQKDTVHALKKIGLKARVSSRTKEVDSLVRKALKQVKEGRTPTFESFVDKVGVRAIVRYQEDVDEAVAALKIAFECMKIEYKNETRLNEFGYRSCHMDIRLLAHHKSYSLYRSFPAELQVRTLAQDLWAEMAHELSYKSVLRTADPTRQKQIDRRIYVLSALVESADMEFSRINNEILNAPGASRLLILDALEREYYKFTSQPYDTEFSLEVIDMVSQISTRTLQQLKDDLSRFAEENEVKLEHIFSDQAGNPFRSAFLFQPEVFLIFECLQNRPIALEEIWEEHFPAFELEQLATVWGSNVF